MSEQKNEVCRGCGTESEKHLPGCPANDEAMSEQKWTLHKVSHSGNVTIVSPDGTWITYAWVPPEEDGVPSKVWNGLRRLVECASACDGIPDPAAFVAQAIENGEQGVKDNAELDRLRADLAELRAQHAQDQADREHYMGKLGEALAEADKLKQLLPVRGNGGMDAVTDAVVDLLGRYGAAVQDCLKLRTVYAAAVEECKWWRQLAGELTPAGNMPGWYHHDGKGWFHSNEADTHDTARAEAGMENL